MPVVNVEALLAPISPEDPAGPDLGYDREFMAFEQMAQGKPEQQMGNSRVPAEEPDWRVVAKQATDLLGRTKDLRLGCHLTKALLRTGGVEGLSDGLGVLHGLVERYWETVHPRLDPDDDNDPAIRVNTLAGLCDGATLTAVRTTPLVSVKAIGRFTLRDLALATGEVPPAPDQPAPELSTIEAAFEAVELEALSATTAALRASLDHVAGIETLVTEKVGSSSAVSLAKLSGLLFQAHKHAASRLSRRSAVANEGGADEVAGAGAGAGAARGGGMPGEIRSREDVVRALDQISAYYQRYEPSSPMPLLMKRCRRLATMSFLEIMKDVAPDAMSQATLLRGHSDPDEGSS